MSSIIRALFKAQLIVGILFMSRGAEAAKTIKCWVCPYNEDDPSSPEEAIQWERQCTQGDSLGQFGHDWQVDCTGNNPVCVKDYWEKKIDFNGGVEVHTTRLCIPDVRAWPFFTKKTDFCAFEGDDLGTINRALCACQGDYCNESIKIGFSHFLLALAFALLFVV